MTGKNDELITFLVYFGALLLIWGVALLITYSMKNAKTETQKPIQNVRQNTPDPKRNTPVQDISETPKN
jgi:hypothetical protein